MRRGSVNLAYSSEDTFDTVASKVDSRGRQSKARPFLYENLHPAFLPPLVTRTSRHTEEDQRRPRAAPVSSSWQLARRSCGRPDPRLSLLGGELDYKNYNFNYDMFLAEELRRLSHAPHLGYRKKKHRRKCVKTFCKFFCFLILLVSFILVIVCVSVFIIKDKYNT